MQKLTFGVGQRSSIARIACSPSWIVPPSPLKGRNESPIVRVVISAASTGLAKATVEIVRNAKSVTAPAKKAEVRSAGPRGQSVVVGIIGAMCPRTNPAAEASRALM
ncbi:MAG: hypothetical protein KC458_08175 [Dehalococcoidia bacterium]|nr:hypothetical protein [Dehalococcoidia bacterium]MCA9857238.1 hypothetical protein [Dehalococcoidia bacterium]MCB9482596.1 hypothetical protein [Dehalococcoidia bacterium]